MTYDSNFYEDLQGRVRAALLLVADQLPAVTVGVIDELIDHNESGVAVEMLSDALVGADAVLSQDTVVIIGSLVDTMGLDQQLVERLRSLVDAATTHHTDQAPAAENGDEATAAENADDAPTDPRRSEGHETA